jgi:DNA-binding transcriptional regulator/RsmH inhibitor MraZ
MNAFKKIHSLGTTIIIVSHNPRVAQKAEIRYEMTDGHLRLTGQTINGNKITVMEDKVGRLRIPYSWISQLDMNDDLIGLKDISGQLVLVTPDQDDLLDFVNFDAQGRIRLPANLRKGENYKWNIERQAKSIYISPMEEN